MTELADRIDDPIPQWKGSKPSVLSGSLDHVRRALESVESLGGDQLVVLRVAREDSAQIASAVQRITELVIALKLEPEQEILQTLVKAIAPAAPPTHERLIELRMLAESRKAILESGSWLKAKEVADLAQLSPTNASSQPNRWKRERQIFAISHNGVDYFPLYALDPANGYRPREALSTLLDIFGGSRDAWQLASWFLAVNGRLGGRRPQDVLETDPKAVIEAARKAMLAH